MIHMELKKAYYVSRKNVLTWLSVLLILCSAVVRLMLHGEKGTVSSIPVAFQIWLSVLAGICYIWIVLLHGKERIYRTAIPVALFCLGEAVGIGSGSLWYHLLLWLVCAVIALAYTQVISGRVSSSSDRLMIILMLLAVLVVRLGVAHSAIRANGITARIRADIPVMAGITGLICLLLSLRIYRDGAHHKSWGDRYDGRLIRSMKPMEYVGPYIMTTRNTACNFFKESVDVTDVDRYIRRRRREGMTQLTITQIFLAAYCRTVARHPGVNRFISGHKIYTRDGEIIFSMMVKKEMTAEGEETAIKLHLRPDDTLETVSRKLDEAIRAAKSDEENSFDAAAGVIRAIPGVFKRIAILILRGMDYFGFLPKSLEEISPFHGTIFFTSMASLGIPAIYHHLYDFGNLPVFCCLGGKYRKNVLDEDGQVQERKFMDFTIVCDERICDGFYYASAFKTFKRLIQHPERLEIAPECVLPDID